MSAIRFSRNLFLSAQPFRAGQVATVGEEVSEDDASLCLRHGWAVPVEKPKKKAAKPKAESKQEDAAESSQDASEDGAEGREEGESEAKGDDERDDSEPTP